MLVDPKLDEVVNGERGMLTGIRICLQSQCLVSAVTLMFSSLDALAALTRPVGQPSTNGGVFKAWISRFIKPESTLGCTPDDLWGVRCGVLHLYSPESALSAKNKARRIYYQWKAGPAADASRAIPQGSLVITVEALHSAIEQAVHDFIIASEMDDEIKSQVGSHLSSLLCYEPFSALVVTLAA
ncbi:MAG: hypothetical protein GEU77_01235 [Deltaproteobacteria bacterium]|nr:hypothetical protein [Deltaproteobacteria bacterium]